MFDWNFLQKNFINFFSKPNFVLNAKIPQPDKLFQSFITIKGNGSFYSPRQNSRLVHNGEPFGGLYNLNWILWISVASSQEKSGVVHRRGERGSSQVPIKFFSSGLTEQQDEQSEETPEPVLTIPTLGHQPVILGGLYSHSEDEFLPGKTL